MHGAWGCSSSDRLKRPIRIKAPPRGALFFLRQAQAMEIRMGRSTSTTDATRRVDAPGVIPQAGQEELGRSFRSPFERLLEDELSRKTAEDAVDRVLAGVDSSEVDQEEPAPAYASQPGIYVYRLQDVDARWEAMRSRDDPDALGRVRATLISMRKRGCWRALRVLGDNWRSEFDRLEAMFPNFARLLDFLRSQAALAARGDGALPGMAILLDGPPGIGKSVIVEAIAEIIGGGWKRVSLAAAQSGGELAGSDQFWSNSKPGAIFDCLVHGTYANPVIQLDEIDKVAPDLPYHPLGALYDLLEPAMAKQFRDASLPAIPLDASRIIWIATSNQRRFVMGPILDRLTVIEAAEPTAREMAPIVASVDQRLHATQPLLAGMTLSEEAALELGTLPPRRLRKALEEAYGRAALHGRDVVLPEDLPGLDDAVPAIGFR